MIPKIILIAALVFHVRWTLGKILDEDLSQFMANMKAELARNMFKPRLLKKDLTKVTLNQEKDFEMNVTSASESGGSLFRRSKENYLFNGSRVLQLHKESDRESYFLDVALELSLEEGFVFVKNVEWQKIFFLAVCYRNGYCQVVMSHSETGLTIQQRIGTRGSPSDLEFFVDDGELYLVVAADPCKIYRWTGAYFDEHDELDTSGAKAVAVFRDRDVVVIVVAQSLTNRKVYSKVYVRKNRKTELTQLLQTAEAVDVVPYELRAGQEILRFVLVVENVESKIFWWNGREFSLWNTLDGLVGPSQIYVDTVQAELFIFVVSQNKLRVYHPTEITFDLVHVFVLDREILSFDLREEPNRSKVILLLTRSEFGPFLTLSFVSIDVNYIPVSENQIADADPVLRCLLELKKSLEDRDTKLEESISLSEEIEKKNGMIKLDNLSIPRVELKNFRIKHLKVNPNGKELEATPTEIKKELEEVKEESDELLAKIRSAPKEVRYRIHGDIVVSRLKAPRIQVRKFNDRTFDLSNILSVTKNQTLGGTIQLRTLSTETLTLPSINGIHIRDLLLRNKPVQHIMGEHTIRSMKARNVVLGRLGKLNGSYLARSVEDKVVRGKKTFPRMTVNRLQVDHINNVPAEKWLEKILPSFEAFSGEQVFSFEDLKVKNLTVVNINGLPWKNYLNSTVSGASPRVNTTKAKRLTTKRINGVDASSFMTKDTPQNVSSTVEVTSANFAYIKPKHLTTCGGTEREAKPDSSPDELFDRVRTSKVIFKNPVNVSGRIIDFDKVNETYWMKSQPQFVGSLTLAELTANKTEIGSINNRRMEDFARADEPNRVTGRITLEKAEVTGDVTVSAESGLRKFYDSAVKTRGENRIKGKKKFVGHVGANEVFADFINGANISERNPGAKGIYHLERAEIVGDLFVKDEIHLNRVNSLSDAISVKVNSENNRNRKGGKRSEKFSKLRIIVKGDLEVAKLAARRVNDVPFDDYMSKVVLKNGPETSIKGRKIFRGKATVRGNLDGVVNGRDLVELRSAALSKTRPQNITGPVIVDELNVNDVESAIFDGLPTDRLLFQDVPAMQFIDSDVVFSGLGVAGSVEASIADTCDMANIAKVNLRKIKKIAKLDVKGDVAWDKDRKGYNGISYLYKNAVRSNREQIISGSVTFSKNVTFENLATKKHLRGVDLEFIVGDALYASLPVQEISRDVTFKGRVEADSVLIANNAIVDKINGLDVLDFGQRLVRNSEDAEVTGKKEFMHGFSTFRLQSDEISGSKVNNVIFCDSSRSGGSIQFPPATFNSVKIVENLNVLSLNSVNLDDLLQERLSKTRNETVSAFVTVKGSLLVKGESSASRINDVYLNETVSVWQEISPKLIKGRIKFNETVSLNNLQVETMNKYDVTGIRGRSLMKGEDSTLTGNIIFSGDLELEGGMNVETANGCDVKKLKPMEISQNIGEEDVAYVKKLESETEKTENISDALTKPLVFVDLKISSNFKMDLLNVEKIIGVGRDEFHFYGSGGDGFPAQTKLTVSDPVTVENLSYGYYKYYDDHLEMEFAVNTSSTGLPEEESRSTAYWKKMTENSYISEKLNFTARDVRFFRIANSVYVIMVEKVTNGSIIAVEEIDTVKGEMKKVQEIQVKAAQILEIFWSPKGFVLVAGNGYDSEIFTESVESAIYRFSDSENKFRLLRTVNTHGILSISSVTQNKNSFIFLTQKQSWPFLILKYNHEYDNYYLSQKLDVAQSRVKSNFLSGSAFSTSRPGYDGDIFLGVVQSDESFRLFKYKHIEGFVEELLEEQNNVKMLLPFTLGAKQYLLAASSGSNSTIYEFVQDGFID